MHLESFRYQNKYTRKRLLSVRRYLTVPEPPGSRIAMVVGDLPLPRFGSAVTSPADDAGMSSSALHKVTVP